MACSGRPAVGSLWAFLISDLVDLGLFGLELADNKKGPEEAPTHTARIWDGLAIPGGAPGYDDNKKFGNNIPHLGVQLPKGCATYTALPRNVKAKAGRTAPHQD
jgi:hypothetical protein